MANGLLSEEERRKAQLSATASGLRTPGVALPQAEVPALPLSADPALISSGALRPVTPAISPGRRGLAIGLGILGDALSGFAGRPTGHTARIMGIFKTREAEEREQANKDREFLLSLGRFAAERDFKRLNAAKELSEQWTNLVGSLAYQEANPAERRAMKRSMLERAQVQEIPGISEEYLDALEARPGAMSLLGHYAPLLSLIPTDTPEGQAARMGFLTAGANLAKQNTPEALKASREAAVVSLLQGITPSLFLPQPGPEGQRPDRLGSIVNLLKRDPRYKDKAIPFQDFATAYVSVNPDTGPATIALLTSGDVPEPHRTSLTNVLARLGVEAPGLAAETQATKAKAEAGELGKLTPAVLAGKEEEERRLGKAKLLTELQKKEQLSKLEAGLPASLTETAGLRGEFQRMSEGFLRVRNAYDRMEDAFTRATTKKSGAADHTMLVTFNKLLDEMSVVREGEVAMTQAAGGLKAQVDALISRLKGEGLLGDDQRIQLLEQARGLFRTMLVSQGDLEQRFTRLATTNNMRADRIVGEGFLKRYEHLVSGRPAPESSTPADRFRKKHGIPAGPPIPPPR